MTFRQEVRLGVLGLSRDFRCRYRPIGPPCIGHGPQQDLVHIDCIDCSEWLFHAFHCHKGEDANCVVAGLTIANGTFDDCSDVIDRSENSPTIYGCRIIGSMPEEQYLVGDIRGVIRCDRGAPTISHCAITGTNSAGSSNSVAICRDSGNPTITDCTVSENLDCGGIDWRSSNAAITNCAITEGK